MQIEAVHRRLCCSTFRFLVYILSSHTSWLAPDNQVALIFYFAFQFTLNEGSSCQLNCVQLMIFHRGKMLLWLTFKWDWNWIFRVSILFLLIALYFLFSCLGSPNDKQGSRLFSYFSLAIPLFLESSTCLVPGHFQIWQNFRWTTEKQGLIIVCKKIQSR
jgi:hypothetical protein